MKGDYVFLERSQVTSYEVYKEKFKDSDKKLDYWSYRKLLATVSNLIYEEVLNNCLGFKLPNRLGYLIMVGSKPKVISNEIVKKRLHLARTEGYVYKLHWIYNKNSFPKSDVFTFKTSRLFQDKAKEYIKNDKFFSWMTFERKYMIKNLKKEGL